MRKDKDLDQRREELGHYANIVQKLQMEDTDWFKEMMRMDFEVEIKLSRLQKI